MRRKDAKTLKLLLLGPMHGPLYNRQEVVVSLCNFISCWHYINYTCIFYSITKLSISKPGQPSGLQTYTLPIDFPCGTKPEYPAKTPDNRQNFDLLISREAVTVEAPFIRRINLHSGKVPENAFTCMDLNRSITLLRLK